MYTRAKRALPHLLAFRLAVISDYGLAACVPAKCMVWAKEGVGLISIPHTGYEWR